MKTINSPNINSFNQIYFQKKLKQENKDYKAVSTKQNSKKIILSLAALSACAIAAVAIYKHKNKPVSALNPQTTKAESGAMQKLIKKSRENIDDVSVDEGILNEHQKGFFASIRKGFETDYQKQIEALQDEYKQLCAKGETLENSTLAKLDGCDKYCVKDNEKVIYAKTNDAFPKEKAYIKAVLKRIKEMVKAETIYLKKQPALEKDHEFYRAFTPQELETLPNKASFADMLKDSSITDKFSLDSCPVDAKSDLGSVLSSAEKDSDGLRKIFRIYTNKGNHLPYSKTGETLFPTDSQFEFLGCEKIDDVEIYNLDYRPFEIARSFLGLMGLHL